MTIFAQSSGKGIAGIAVIRISGDAAADVVRALTRKNLPEARRAVVRPLYAGGDDTPIDKGLVLWLPGPASFTGEDMAELHIHGGIAVVDGILQAIAAVPGCVPAEPGAFTRLAFDHGRLDLTEAEGIADLIAAETEAQRRQAIRQMDGVLGRLYEDWRTDLVRALAYMEAELDFVEESLPEDLFAQVMPAMTNLSAAISEHLDDNHRGERLRDGFQIVIIGEPNVGKSSFINALSKRDVAIVSDIPGTTRDMIEVHLNLGGFPVTLVDTAGLRESGDQIELEGVRRARQRAEGADFTLLMVDAANPTPMDDVAYDLMVMNKIDQAGKPPSTNEGGLALSVKTGDGLDGLLARLESVVTEAMGTREAPALTRLRHRQALEVANDHLQRAIAGVERGQEPELVAEDMRLSARALGRITGRVDVEDLLDVIFSDFCIGK